MNEQTDVWIEVNEAPPELSRFFRTVSVAMPQYGGSIGRLTIQFNLTAYVKHVIEQAKQD